MYRARAAPEPLVRVACRSWGAPPLVVAASTSALVMRPPRALPVTVVRSIPSAAAIRWATGDALAAICISLPTACGGAGAASSSSARRAGLHPRDHLPDRHGRPLLDEDLRDRAASGSGQLHVDLVGRDLDDGVAVGDRVADLHRPFEDRPLGDRLAAGGGDDLDDLTGAV